MTRGRDVEDLEFVAGLEPGEAKGVLLAEDGTAPHPGSTTRLATDYVHTTHPDTGIEVVFVPGEALPPWA